MNTNDLIDNLARGLEPVTPLWRPGRRAAAWAIGAVLYLAVLVIGMSLATDSQNVGIPLWVSQAAAVVTGVLAALAAFNSVVPGSPNLRVWAVLAGVVWLGTLVMSSAWDWAAVATASHEWLCVGFIVLGGAPLMVALAVMLRRGAPLRPAATGALAALAVGALANVGACLSLPHANGAITFAWHGGTVVLLVAAAAWSGQLVFRWSGAQSRSSRRS